jgi:hypothetical protein
VSKNTLRFTENEVWRAIRAVRKSGLPIARVMVNPETGEIAVITAGEAGAGSTSRKKAAPEDRECAR